MNLQTTDTLSTKTAAQLESEGKLVCILKPAIRERTERLIADSAEPGFPFIAQSGDQLYISLAGIEDEVGQAQAYDSIQRFQAGLPTDLSALPIALQQLLDPKQRQSHSLRGVTFCIFLGVAFGILAMAVSILAIAVAELILKTTLDQFSGLQITAVTFVIFTVIGWALSFVFFARFLRR